jgi:hypothetical protein
MSTTTYLPYVPGTLPSADHVYGRFYTWDGDSLEVINGRLDDRNLSTDFSVNYTSLQPNATSGGGQVAGTANLDYFSGSRNIDGWFKGTRMSAGEPPGETLESAGKKLYVPIPGACTQFYLPYKAFVLLTWQITWTNDSSNNGEESHVRLFVDNYRPFLAEASRSVESTYERYQHCNVRRVGRTVFSGADLKDRYKSRYWCGHQWLDTLGKGWHSAGLRVVASPGSYDRELRQTRIRARSMKHIYFKRSDG